MSNELLQNIGKDLVDKKLWPVALALAVATAAVPLVLSDGSSAPVTTAAIPAATTPSSDSAAQLALRLSETTGLSKPPKVNKRELDPFGDRGGVKTLPPEGVAVGDAQATLGTEGMAGTSGSASVTGTGGLGGVDGEATAVLDGAPATTPASTAAPKGKKTVKDALTLMVREDSKTASILEDQPRDTVYPEGDDDDPLFVYDRKNKDGAAVFTVSSTLKVKAPAGACAPSASDCQTLTLGPGEEATLTPIVNGTTPSGSVVTTITVIKVGTTKTSSAAATDTGAATADATVSMTD